MSQHAFRRIVPSAALAIALAGTSFAVFAQSAPPSSAFLKGTETSATYPLPNSNGGTLTVHAGMPAQVQQYGPPPAFKALDTNHDGRISEAEAQAYPPLDNEFLLASGNGKSIGPAQYKAWAAAAH